MSTNTVELPTVMIGQGGPAKANNIGKPVNDSEDCPPLVMLQLHRAVVLLNWAQGPAVPM
jgi:hypothetical protein